MHYLYRITNQLSGKVYIGQSNSKRRWSQHLYFAKYPERTGQYIHRAMAKYGSENFIYEVIATCRTQKDANILEDVLIQQYDSRNNNKGYNLNAGGFNGAHSEETKEKIRQATIHQIATQGHPSAGREVSQEQRDLLRKIRLENPIEYTEEIRQHMSEVHLGHQDSDETKDKKYNSAKEAWDKRIDYSRKCEFPNCEASGKIKYKIIDGIRYCNKHGLRKLRELDRL
jgi:group I intron endonuclease